MSCKGTALVLAAASLAASVAYAAGPSWWTERGVVDGSIVAADDAPVLLGQVKWMAAKARDELEANLPNGAGQAVDVLVDGFSATNNYLTANVGQLKYVAMPFHDRLKAEGYHTNAWYYPWTETTTDDVEYAVANIGQLKHLFDFDLTTDTDSDGLPDWWEMFYFGDLDENAAGDTDSDSYDNSTEFNYGSDPSDLNSVPTCSVAGTVYYSGGQAGSVVVLAAVVSNAWSGVTSNVISNPGSYSVAGIPALSNYWVKAWRDSNANGSNDATEAWGAYTNNPIYLTNDTSGADMVLTDPDADSDGLADWTETGTGVFVSPYDTGTSSSTNDTDGDGILDGTEVANRTDPNSNDTTAPTVLITLPTDGYRVIWIP